MEQKTNALKTASKVISVITKIGYTVMIVVMCICVAMLIFLGVSGGKTSMLTIGKTNIIFFDNLAATPAEIVAMCFVLIVMGGIFFTIFLLAYQMFHKISVSGEPFKENYVKTIRVIGILTAVLPFATGITGLIVTLFTQTQIPQITSEIPGIIVGAIIFCLSYVIDYGCGITKTLNMDIKEKTEK